MSYLRKTNINETDLGTDAWGRNKMVLDHSQLSGLFTYDIPDKMWKEMIWDGADYIEQTSFTKSISINGSLSLTAGTTLNNKVMLRSKDHARYQANRGALYSVSLLFPNPTASGTRRAGLLLPCNGLFFELIGDGTNYVFNLVIRNHFVDTKYDITNQVPSGFDFSKGNLYDIQMQWRGVGDFKVFLNLEEIFVTSELGSRTQISIENPSLPAGFECINSGDDVELICGCVDITSEGGRDLIAKYTSFSTGQVMKNVGSAETALIAIRMPYKVSYGGVDVCYSRDAILNQINTFCKDEAIVSVYISRGVYLTDLPNIVWTQEDGGFMEYVIGGNSSELDTAFLIDKANMRLIKSFRQEKDYLVKLEDPSYMISPFVINADTYIVVSVDPDAATLAGCTLECSVQL